MEISFTSFVPLNFFFSFFHCVLFETTKKLSRNYILSLRHFYVFLLFFSHDWEFLFFFTYLAPIQGTLDYHFRMSVNKNLVCVEVAHMLSLFTTSIVNNCVLVEYFMMMFALSCIYRNFMAIKMPFIFMACVT